MVREIRLVFRIITCDTSSSAVPVSGAWVHAARRPSPAADHIAVLELALEHLPADALDGEILARSDSAGASHDFAAALRETDVRFSLAPAFSCVCRASRIG